MSEHFVYILTNTNWPQKTYEGYTIAPARRLRCHNGFISNGARYTSRYKPYWEFLVIVASPQFTKHTALSFEWSVRHPTNRRARPATFNGIQGRLRSLPVVLRNPKFCDFDYDIYVQGMHLSTMQGLVASMANVRLHTLDAAVV
jgi:predicted GIY-YIG superfamily endonuclease